MADTDQSTDESIRIPLGLLDLPSHRQFVLPPPKQLFHYTSLDGANGIITTKSLYLTKVAYLNDRSELSFAIQQFRQAVHSLSQTIESEERRSILTQAAHQLGSFERTNVCVASFCEDPDLLSQWRSYGHVGRGVALGFSGEILAGLNQSGWARLVRCVYDPNVQRRIVDELVMLLLAAYDKAATGLVGDDRKRMAEQIIGYFNTTFLRVAPVLKDRHFSEEKEWRIVTVPQRTTDPKFRATVSRTRISEYYVYEFSANADGSFDFLSSIAIGPTDDAELISNAMHTLCLRNNVRIQGISFSRIPFRGR